MARKIQFKRGLKANLPKLSTAEIAFTTDEKKAYIGDGNENIRLLDQKDKTEITAQLAENVPQNLMALKNAVSSGSGDYSPRPLVSFIDDDGNPKIFSVLAQIYKSRNVPCSVALTSNAGVPTDPALIRQMKDLQNNHGWEVMSHTYAHERLRELNENQLRENFEKSLKDLTSKGFNVESIVYPFGDVTRDTRRVVRDYFRSGFNVEIGEKINDYKKTDVYDLLRIEVGKETERPLSYYTDFVDKAKAENKWLVFFHHCWYPEFDEKQQAILGQLIDYIKQQGIEIVTPKRALDYFKPVVDVGSEGVLSDYFKLTKTGEVFSNHAIDLLPQDTHPASDTISKYINPITVFSVTSNYASANGWVDPGTVITIKGSKSLKGFNYQLFLPYTSTGMKIRRSTSNSDETWTAWDKVVTEATINSYQRFVMLAYNAKAETDLMSTYPLGMSMHNANGWSLGNGLVTTYRVNGNQIDKQEFRKGGTNQVYSRTTDSSGNWLPFEKISAI